MRFWECKAEEQGILTTQWRVISIVGSHLCTAKVTELELVGGRVDQQVLRLDVAVTHALLVDVVQGAAHLVHIQFHKHGGHALPALGVVLGDAVHRLRYVLQHQVLPHLVLLRGHVEAVLQADHVGVGQHLHDLQLPVLVPLVLQYLLDCHLQDQHASQSLSAACGLEWTVTLFGQANKLIQQANATDLESGVKISQTSTAGCPLQISICISRHYACNTSLKVAYPSCFLKGA